VIGRAVAGAIARPYGSTVDPRVVIVPAVDTMVRMEGETVTAGAVIDMSPPHAVRVITRNMQETLIEEVYFNIICASPMTRNEQEHRISTAA
jgi:hypothetical protein